MSESNIILHKIYVKCILLLLLLLLLKIALKDQKS